MACFGQWSSQSKRVDVARLTWNLGADGLNLVTRPIEWLFGRFAHPQSSTVSTTLGEAVGQIAPALGLLAHGAHGPLGAAMPINEPPRVWARSEEHTSELQSRGQLVCRLLLA